MSEVPNRGPEIDPDLEEFADHISFSAISAAMGGIASYYWIRHNLDFMAPISIAGGMLSGGSWQKSWHIFDNYKTSKNT